MSVGFVVVIVFANSQEGAVDKGRKRLASLYTDPQFLEDVSWWSAFDARSAEEPHGIADLSDKNLPAAIRLDWKVSKKVIEDSGICSEDTRFTIFDENGMEINSAELLQAFLTAGLVRYNCE